jgi:hypothetical protein
MVLEVHILFVYVACEYPIVLVRMFCHSVSLFCRGGARGAPSGRPVLFSSVCPLPVRRLALRRGVGWDDGTLHRELSVESGMMVECKPEGTSR